MADRKRSKDVRGKRHEHEETVRKGYEAAEDAEAQGDGDPGPQRFRDQSSLQGHAGRDPQQPT